MKQPDNTRLLEIGEIIQKGDYVCSYSQNPNSWHLVGISIGEQVTTRLFRRLIKIEAEATKTEKYLCIKDFKTVHATESKTYEFKKENLGFVFYDNNGHRQGLAPEVFSQYFAPVKNAKIQSKNTKMKFIKES
jgi:hypothetical protein